MKKCLALLLLFLFSMQVIFNVPVMLGWQSFHKSKQFSTSIRTAGLVTFNSIELKQLKAKWENKKEFVIGINRYDVSKIEIINGVITYYCKHDKKEQHLLSFLNSQLNFLLDNFSNDSKAPSKTPVKNLNSIKEFELFSYSLSIRNSIEIFAFDLYKQSSILNSIFEITSPPPKQLIS